MRLLILTCVILASVGCSKSVKQTPDAVSVSRDVLTACLQAAGGAYDFQQANLSANQGRVSEHFYEVQDFESRRALDASRALCEQQHTNRLLEELLNRRQQVR